MILNSVTDLPTTFGRFSLHIWTDAHQNEILALATGETLRDNALVRIHSGCLTGDMLGSLRCDCGPQLRSAQELIAQDGNGALIYLRHHEGRGIGLTAKIQAYALQSEGLDTIEANRALGLPDDARNYAAAIAALSYFNLRRVRLLTNNPDKLATLQEAGFAVTRVATILAENPHNTRYLATKRARCGHELGAPSLP